MSKLIVGINDLATIYPNIATEWHPTLNGNLHPNEVFSSSSKMVWWVCDKGHSYQQTIKNRTLKQRLHMILRQDLERRYGGLVL